MRTSIFIDGNYLYKNSEKILQEKPKLNWDGVRDCLASLVEKGTMLRCYYYDALPALSNPPTSEEKEWHEKKQHFVDALSYLPYFEPRIGYCRYVEIDGNKRPIQKKVDVLLAVDLLQLASQHAITDAVIVAGDGDFVPALEAAKMMGVCIHLVHAEVTSVELKKIADTTHEIDLKMIKSWSKKKK